MSTIPPGPPAMDGLDHVNLPCSDLDEGIKFYTEVLGGKKLVHEAAFAMFELRGTHIGIGSDGCTFIAANDEYPHVGLTCNAEALVQMKEWLTACGIPSSNFWTRQGVETMMFFRDPWGNNIGLYCLGGYEGAEDLPRGPAKGHGTAVDIDAISYDSWSVPGKK